MTLPRDFVEEVENELRAARAAFAHDRLLVAALEELRAIARAVAEELLRPVTVFDVIEAAGKADERERRANLVRLVRSPQVGSPTRERERPAANRIAHQPTRKEARHHER